MNWLRKGVVALLSIVLLASLLGGVAAFNLNNNFGTADKLKKQIDESGFYDKALDAVLKSSQSETDTSGNGDVTVSLTDPQVQAAAKQVFTKALIQQITGTFIDANYAWLNGTTNLPKFTIDLSSAKQDFASLVGEYVEARLKSLPECTNEQLAQLQTPISSLNVSCRPATINPTTEGARVADAVRSNDFLTKPTITADSLGREDQSQGKTYYQSLSKAPKFFQLLQKLPFIAAGIALLSILGIIFISPKRRKGYRRVGVVLTLAGILLIATKFISDFILDKITARLHDSVNTQLGAPRDSFLGHAIDKIGQVNLIAGIIFIVLAVAIFVALYVTRNKAAKPPKTPSEASFDKVSEEAPTPSRKLPVSDVSSAPQRPAKIPPKPPIKPSGTAPQFKKPAKPSRPPRPPRLVQ